MSLEGILPLESSVETHFSCGVPLEVAVILPGDIWVNVGGEPDAMCIVRGKRKKLGVDH